MPPEDPAVFMVPLTGPELTVVADALVAFATAEEGHGDPCGVAPVADCVRERIHGFEGLNRWPLEWMKLVGLGSYRGRRQG